MIKTCPHPSGAVITFDEGPHLYGVEGEDVDGRGRKKSRFISGTTFIKNFFPEFDRERISLRYAEKHDRSQTEVLKEWDEKGKVGRENGTEVHNFMEQLFLGKKPKLMNGKGEEGPTDNPRVRAMQIIGINAFKEVKDRYKLVEAEQIFASLKHDICGMADLIGINKETGCSAIIDWKTNKKIDYSNQWQCGLGVLRHLDDCSFNKYAIQLNLYEYIAKTEGYMTDSFGEIEKVLVHITDSSYLLIQVPDMQKEIRLMVEGG